MHILIQEWGWARDPAFLTNSQVMLTSHPNGEVTKVREYTPICASCEGDTCESFPVATTSLYSPMALPVGSEDLK